MSTIMRVMHEVRRTQPRRLVGRVNTLRGLSVYVDELPAPVGSLVSVGSGDAVVSGEVVGFTREHSIVMLLGQSTGVRPGDPVVCEQTHQTAPVGWCMVGRVMDGLGRPIDDKGALRDTRPAPLEPEPLKALRRRPISEPIFTGIRAVDLMTTLGKGQRLGVFAGPGVGKSTLMGTIARRTTADVNVIALIGERGREVREFIEHSLGPEGLARSVVIVATGDESPLLRVRAAKLACAAAEFFRDAGRDVMLMMDSVTRFAHALRQVGLSVGEPPATKGYTPSVFAGMALLLERAGSVEAAAGAGTPKSGSLTGLYTILVEGDDMTEPVSDAARGILDGHVILSRKLAQRNHYPAVDVLDSVSRVADAVTDSAHQAARRTLLRLLALYRDVEDLVQIGAYTTGTNPESDVAIEFNGRIVDLLRQRSDDVSEFAASKDRMMRLAAEAADTLQKRLKAKGR